MHTNDAYIFYTAVSDQQLADAGRRRRLTVRLPAPIHTQGMQHVYTHTIIDTIIHHIHNSRHNYTPYTH
jgi:hypothetical protein